jgi:hypothetical protein
MILKHKTLKEYGMNGLENLKLQFSLSKTKRKYWIAIKHTDTNTNFSQWNYLMEKVFLNVGHKIYLENI